MANQRVWLITGCSSGFGWELCREALSRGDRVIATSRNAQKLADLKHLGASTVELDVCQPDEIVNRIVAKAVEEHGRIDILVNNAGYPLEGIVEACRCVEALLRLFLSFIQVAASSILPLSPSQLAYGSLSRTFILYTLFMVSERD